MTMEVYRDNRGCSQSFNRNLFRNSNTCSEVKSNIVGSQLPQWIQGNILYNSPAGIFDFRNMSARHWNDGMSIMSLFKIKGRDVYFSKKFLRSNAFQDAMKYGRIVWPEFGTPSSKNFRYHKYDNKSTNNYLDNDCHQDQFECYGGCEGQCQCKRNYGYNYRFNRDGNCDRYNDCNAYNDCDRYDYNKYNEWNRFDECNKYNDCNKFGDYNNCGETYRYNDCNQYANGYRRSRIYECHGSCENECTCKNDDYYNSYDTYPTFNQNYSRNWDPSMNHCMSSFKKFSDNCAISFYQYGNLTLATSETGYERIIDPYTLETGDLVNMTKYGSMKTAKPLRDHNGDVYNLGTSMVSGTKYRFYKFTKPESGMRYNRENYPDCSDIKFISTIPSQWPTYASYNHSFGMTDNYLIMCEQPWSYNVKKLCNLDNKHMSYRNCLEWRASDCNQFHVVHKKTGQTMEIKYISNTPFYFLNFINCYEYGSYIVVDMIVYESPDMVNQMQLDRLRSNSFSSSAKSKAYRFVLPLEFCKENMDLNQGKWKDATAYKNGDTITLTPHRIAEHEGIEQPKVNPNFMYRKYDYFYGVAWMQGMDRCNYYSGGISKIDVSTGRTYMWRGSEYCHPSEIVFIPNPSNTSEDDGIIVSCISNTKPNCKDYIVFIDAKNMNELARASFNQKIPFGNHTYFVRQCENNGYFGNQHF